MALLTCVVGLALAPVAGAATAAAPIVGDWNDGGVVRITQTAPNQFELHRVTARPGPCGTTDPDIKLSGSGRAYQGTVQFYRNDNCAPSFRGGFSVMLSTDLTTAGWASTAPAGSCCSGAGTWTRVGAAPCQVPRTRGKTVAAARSALRAAHCRVGATTFVRSRAVGRGRVIRTTPAAGTVTSGRVKIVARRR